MSSYSGTADHSDRTKAIAAVLLVHAALAVIIVAGLNVRMVSRAIEQLQTFDIREPPPPPPPPPPPATRPHAATRPQGAPARKAEPTPVVAPQPKLPVPSPIPAAKVAGAGSAATSGAGVSGNGTGAGGSGNGPGGGGTDYSRFSPAQLVRNLSRSDYQAIAGGRLPTGRAMVGLRIEASGAVGSCRIVRSSGDSDVDASLCPLISERLRFRPARDDQGRPIPYQLQYVATWAL